MRNPLSAIIHCCDGIIDNLTSTSIRSSRSIKVSEDAINDSLEAARTILHCCVHQKRIVDDILVLSKIESDLLSVAPVNVTINGTISGVLSMFQAEAKSLDIDLVYNVDESISALGVDQVLLDPSRLAQVIINLLTNAIKFTQGKERRYIELRLSATLDRPDRAASGVKYIPRKHVELDMSSADWGSGQDIFLHIAITDSGRGLTPSELDLLFRRFSQASPRTHVHYGGSGLGLYIAREL